jgi:hypothetical protein
MFWIMMAGIIGLIVLVNLFAPPEAVPIWSNLVAAIPFLWDDFLALLMGVDYAAIMTPAHASMVMTFVGALNIYLKFTMKTNGHIETGGAVND